MNRLTTLHIENIAQPDVLTDKILTPNIDKLTKAFQDLRDNIDFLVNQIAVSHYGKELEFISYVTKENKYIKRNLRQYVIERFEWDKPLDVIPKKLALYPEGRCFDITNIAYAFIKNNLDLPEFTILSQYLNEGGIFKIIWGGVNLELQTAFQLGGYYVDISSDTVVWTDDKLTVDLLKNSDFYELTHFREFVRIIEPYHNCTVYRNDCLLEIAPFFPLFIVNNKTSNLSINTSHHLALSNCEQDFIPVNELDELAVLPMTFRKQIKNLLAPNINNSLLYQLFSTSDLHKETNKLATFTQEQQITSLRSAYKLVKFINLTLNSDDLYEMID
jgi:hypothetical protein